MTIHDEILAVCSPELLAQHNTQAITDALNASGRTEVVEYWLTDRGLVVDLVVLNNGDTAMSDSILTKLDAAMTASRSAKVQISRLYNDAKGLNFGDPALRGWFAANTPAVFTDAERDALLSLAVRESVIDEYAVRCIAWSDDGVWQL